MKAPSKPTTRKTTVSTPRTKSEPPPEMASIPELEPEPERTPLADMPPQFAAYPDDLRDVAMRGYFAALAQGLMRGDAVAQGRQAARAYARMNNRRMPD